MGFRLGVILGGMDYIAGFVCWCISNYQDLQWERDAICYHFCCCFATSTVLSTYGL
jgi:hypothetical protein